MHKLLLSAGLATITAAILPMTPATAARTITSVGADYSTTPASFSFMGGTFTFSPSGDIFGPTSVQTSGGAAFQTVFGGVTTYFVDRGTVVIGPGQQFAAVPDTTPVRFSNGNNFFGLRVTSGGSDYYGYAYTTNTTLNSYGFESRPDTAITATVGVPEPASWALLVGGFGLAGASLRRKLFRLREPYLCWRSGCQNRPPRQPAIS